MADSDTYNFVNSKSHAGKKPLLTGYYHFH